MSPTSLPAAGKGGAAAAAEGPTGLFSGLNRKPVVMGCMLFLFQQFAGINALVYFSTSTFKQVGAAVPSCYASNCHARG